MHWSLHRSILGALGRVIEESLYMTAQDQISLRLQSISNLLHAGTEDAVKIAVNAVFILPRRIHQLHQYMQNAQRRLLSVFLNVLARTSLLRFKVPFLVIAFLIIEGKNSINWHPTPCLQSFSPTSCSALKIQVVTLLLLRTFAVKDD